MNEYLKSVGNTQSRQCNLDHYQDYACKRYRKWFAALFAILFMLGGTSVYAADLAASELNLAPYLSTQFGIHGKEKPNPSIGENVIRPHAFLAGTSTGNNMSAAQVGQFNVINATQNGNGNLAAILQNGSYNRLDLKQAGAANIAGVVQLGSYNRALVEQVGYNNRAEIIQAATAANAVIQQYGSNGKARVIQH